MNQNNLEYLQKSLDYLGFGTKLNDVLESAIYRQLEKFSLGINQRYIPGEFRSDPGKGVDQLHFDLNFSKARDSDVYFLNSYDATLTRYNDTPPVSQRFDLERDNRMTALQSYKLLCGLSLQKDIYVKNTSGTTTADREKVAVWFRLDLSVSGNNGNHPLNKFFPGYGFDLEKTIDRYPFKGLDELEKKDAVTRALRYGNLVELSLDLSGKQQAVYVAANPRLKTLDIYTKDMQQLWDNQIFSTGQNQGQKAGRAFEGVLPSPQVARQFPWKQQGDENGPKIGR